MRLDFQHEVILFMLAGYVAKHAPLAEFNRYAATFTKHVREHARKARF